MGVKEGAGGGDLSQDGGANNGGLARANEPMPVVDLGAHESCVLRMAVVDFVRELLRPSWSKQRLSRESFLAISRKATDKVLGTLPNGGLGSQYDSLSGVRMYMTETRKDKIRNLVQGYVQGYQESIQYNQVTAHATETEAKKTKIRNRVHGHVQGYQESIQYGGMYIQ
eukprot:gene19021-25613_t